MQNIKLLTKNETHVKNVIELCGKRCPEGVSLALLKG